MRTKKTSKPKPKPKPHIPFGYKTALQEAQEVLRLCDPEGARLSITAPEDAMVRELCERFGYGAVMDSAARQWREKDPDGAFSVGPCVGTLTECLRKITSFTDDSR